MAASASPAPAPAKESIFAIVKLDEPIVRGDQKVEQVKVRRPDAGALRGLKLVDVINIDVNAMIQLLPRVCDPILLEHELAQMNAADFVALSNEVALFLPQKATLTDFQTA